MSLYKYYHPDSFDFILTDGGVSARFSPPALLNDVFELNGSFPKYSFINRTKNILLESDINISSLTEKELERLSFILTPYLKNDISEINEMISSGFVGIFSLSKVKHSRSMWSYYAADHSGFMIEFETEKNFKPKFLPESQHFNFDFVKYKRKRVESLMTFINPKMINESVNNGSKTTFNDFIFSKDYQWEHEEEYRVIKALHADNEPIDSNGYQLSTIHIPSKFIVSLTLGVRASDSLIRKASYWIRTQAPQTKLYRAEPCLWEYKFNDIEIKI